MYWGLGNGLAAGLWPRPGGDLVTGGSPRYNIYRTRDWRFLAAAPLEQKFWETFCELLEVPHALRDDAPDPAATYAAVAERVQAKTSDELQVLFRGEDVCCAIAATLRDALHDPHFAAREVFARELVAGTKSMPALPVPVDAHFRSGTPAVGYPELGEANDHLLRK
jgi:crotonobetainyl-CoA:carnitine CoA-transferase CaiB-like acyl-CoA transferase